LKVGGEELDAWTSGSDMGITKERIELDLGSCSHERSWSSDVRTSGSPSSSEKEWDSERGGGGGVGKRLRREGGWEGLETGAFSGGMRRERVGGGSVDGSSDKEMPPARKLEVLRQEECERERQRSSWSEFVQHRERMQLPWLLLQRCLQVRFRKCVFAYLLASSYVSRSVSETPTPKLETPNPKPET
jgi:hypothetical protein